MFLTKKETNKETVFVCLDIGSYSVKCGIFSINEENNLELLGYGKKIIENSLDDACLYALNTAKNNSNQNPKDLIVGLSDDKCVMSTTTARIKRPKPESHISDKELSLATKKIQEAAYIELCRELGERLGDPDVQISLLNSDYVTVQVDGKHTLNPKEEKGEIIEASLFTAFAKTSDLEIVKKISKKMGLNLSAVSANTYTMVKALSLKENLKDIIVVDIGGKTTSVSVAFDGGIFQNKWFTVGTHDIVKNVATKFSLELKQAEEVLNHYLEKKISNEESFKIRSAILDVLELWLLGLLQTLSDFEGVKTFPLNIAVTGGGTKIPEVKEMVLRADWSKTLAFKSTPEVKMVNISNLPVTIRNDISIFPEDTTALSIAVVGLEIWGGKNW